MKKTPSAPQSRRTFLKQALLAGTAPLILPRGLWAAGNSPNDRITLGFIGMGTQNRHLLRGFVGRNDTQVLAVCDVDTSRREDAKGYVERFYATRNASGAYKGCTGCNEFEDLLVLDELDGVVIATPDHWHAIIAVAAANAGKDIYCEKPMSHSIEEARAMVDTVRRNKRVLQVGSMQRSSKEFRTACELARNGAVGTIRRVDVSVGGPAKPCDLPEERMEPGLDWDRWLGPAPLRPYNSTLSPRGVHSHFPDWRDYREYGGGDVTDWGAHHFDIAHWGCGFDRTGPLEIIPPEDPKAERGVRLRYANGVEIRHGGSGGVLFFGDNGRIHVNRGEFGMWIGDEQKAADPSDCDQMLDEYLPSNPIRLYQSRHHLEDWLNCMRLREQPVCDVETGARTVTTCILVNLAYYHRERMEWDPAKEEFTNQTGDREWLRDEYRTPYKLS
jgi:predicted dehydrogenase